MVAHAFPPAGGSGPNRALASARYLPMFGWRPVVLTPEARWAINRDNQALRGIPRALTVARTGSFETMPTPSLSASGGRTKRRSVIRGQLGHLKRFPDAHIGWLPHAVAAARKLDFDVIYSSSGPFTSHVVALLLHRLTGKPLVAELRDGWYRWNRAIFPDYPAWRGPLERQLEAAVIRAASRVVLVTPRMANAFRCQYADLPPEHFTVVPNGFDPHHIPPTGHDSVADVFAILHAGALYYGRSLASFLDAVAGLNDPAVRVTLMGTLDETARAELARHRLGDRIEFRGYASHEDALAAMCHASLLLLIANTTPGAEATVPGKLFEYLAIGRPILAIAPPHSATADVMAETNAGWLAPSGDTTAITTSLREAISSAHRSQPRRADRTTVSRYDRRRLAGQLARIFDDVLAPRRL